MSNPQREESSPMSTQQQLYQAVLDNPEDDAPRLIFADWLEENGDPERAAFIREQIDLANTPPDHPDRLTRGLQEWEGRTLASPEKAGEWEPELQTIGTNRWYRRGFVEEVEFRTCQDFLRSAKRLFQLAPVRALNFTGRFTGAKRWSRCEELRWLRGLSFECWDTSRVWPTGVLDGVLCCEPLQQLEFLEVFGMEQHGIEIPVVFQGERPLPNLRALHLVGCACEYIGALTLGSCCHWLQLQSLSLKGNRIDPYGFISIVNSPTFRSLRELDFGWGGPIDETNAVGLEGISSLVQSPLTNLEVLNLNETELDDEAVRRLASWPRLKNLRYLELGFNALTNAGVEVLVSSPNVQNLRRLNIYGDALDEAAARAILESPHLGKLMELNLCVGNIEPATMNKLEEWLGDGFRDP